MEYTKLLSKSMQLDIDNVISNIFIKLMPGQLRVLQDLVIILIDTIACKYNFKENTIDNFFRQISQNENRDIISIMYLILPYIDDKNNYELYKKIQKLEDITCMKKKVIDESENNYTICNYQYSRYINLNMPEDYINNLNNNKFLNKANKYYNEYKYNILDLEMSFKLVLSTIDRISSKLYINWINIIPLTLEDYKESDKYKNSFYYDETKKQFLYKDVFSNKEDVFDFWNLNLDSNLRQYGGVTADDIFNTIYVFLFNQIYNSGTKWLLYEKQIDKNNQPKIYLELLNDLVDITYLYYSEIYDTINLIERNLIERKWLLMLEKAYINSIEGDFIKCIILKFDQNFCNDEILEKYNSNYDYTSLYKKLEKDKDLDLEDEDNFLDYNKINQNGEYYLDYLNKIEDVKKLPFEIIYEFLIEIIQNFKLTWYGKQILEKDKTDKIFLQKIKINTKLKFNKEDNLEIKTDSNKYFVTYKNIYNFAKYISINFNNKSRKGIKVSDSRCLNDNDKIKFFNLINNDIKLFNIKNVINKTYGITSNNDILALQETITNYFVKNLKDIVFITYIQAGLLNRFETDDKITNERILGSSETDRKKNIKKELEKKFVKDKKKYLSTYYYLTGDKYENLDIYNTKLKKIDWFEFTFKEAEPWYFSFAMNWVSQINFYNHFINNRVLLVTGATGQGKSTEVPKLLYYALIAINLNFTARVISTQPTVIPTKNNASIIATNLGVPLKINNQNSFSSYLQYSTQEDKHLVKGSTTFIKEVTDRTLFEEIIKNPYLKKQKKGKNGKMNYSNENVYDIVIIDEAHMHNINMDLILTFMRNVIHINNQIKLVITSATMDDDEYIYRRYYRKVDDNYGFPLCSINSKLEIYNERILKESEHLHILDKIVVDRRYHISPPGQTTKYTVKDIYLDNDTLDYKQAKEEGLQILDKIMKNNLTGDVLFFTTTANEILDIIKYININSPGHVIALPLYSQLKSKPGEWFERIEKININLPNLIYDKKDILDIIEYGDSKYKKIPPNTYSMAIIVATNVVEASVTIPSLRYVIDTGYFNSVIFDSDQEKTVATIDKIPEASRLQRRGRVGRVASGTVYYTYKKGARSQIKPRYGIVTKDITFDLFKILHGFEDNNISKIYNPIFHPINFLCSFKNNDIKKTFNEFINEEPNKIIKKIYETQYWIDINIDNYINEVKLISNLDVNPIDQYIKILNSPYEDGYDLNELMDEYGTFYIIHPDEEYFKREVVTGKIIYNKKREKLIDKYKSTKLIHSINKLQSVKYIYFDNIIKDITKDYIYIKKFKYNKILEEIINKETQTIGVLEKTYGEDDIVRIFKTICISSCYNCTDEILKILSLVYTITSYKDFVALQDINNKFNDYSKFINLWKDNISELFSYLKIMNFFIQNNEVDEKEKKIFTKNEVNNKFNKFIEIKKKYGNEIFIKKNILQDTKIDDKEFKIFIESFNQKENENSRSNKYNQIFKIRQKEKQVKIENYSKNMAINNNIIIKSLRLYDNLKKIVKNQKEKINNFKEFYPVFISSKSDNIIKCFLESYLSNLSIYKNNKLINILLNIEVNEPKISLVYLPEKSHNQLETLCFYILKDDKVGPIGLTIINKDLLNDIIPTKLLNIDNDIDYFNSNDENVLKLSGKYKYNINKENSMNNYIDNSLKIFKIKKYKLKLKDI